eukprot:98851-Pyramimonas_sp.AAC.1
MHIPDDTHSQLGRDDNTLLPFIRMARNMAKRIVSDCRFNPCTADSDHHCDRLANFLFSRCQR